ncbi:MAG TPA: hypothetical protein VJU83_09690 [Burkholderiales bacterium]|nr:hypothetical protein [Burkholderiales bacterium]
MKFAKLFETGDEQILVKLDDGKDGPEIRFYWNPPGLGICNFALQFGGEEVEKAWDDAEAAFTKVDEIQARTLVSSIEAKINVRRDAMSAKETGAGKP